MKKYAVCERNLHFQPLDLLQPSLLKFCEKNRKKLSVPEPDLKSELFICKKYWEIMSMTSIANGLMESVLERRMESIGPDNEKSNNFINKQEIRIIRTIKWLENNWNNYDDSYLTMDQISIACALDYTMFRFNGKWRADNTKLNKWFSNFVEKDFMKSTLPREK